MSSNERTWFHIHYVQKERTLKLIGHIARALEYRKVNKVFQGILRGKRHLGRPRL